MNLTQTSRMYEAFCDLAQARLEREDATAEEKQRYIERRAEELHEQRMSNVSVDDFTIAIDYLSSMRESMVRMHKAVYDGEEFMAAYLQGCIKAALYLDCVEIAKTEANALYEESASRERH
jgi:hypothetical protein